MSTWIIGDVHGCWRTLQRLLDVIAWNPTRDRVWLIGDLVNKGTGSLEVLHWAVAHADRVDSVIGNHDLHLLARAAGAADHRTEDTFDDVLRAPDRDGLLEWLRTRPLLARLGDVVVVHAGLMPQWDLDACLELAAGARSALATGSGVAQLYRLRRTVWTPDLLGAERDAAALAVMTRLRVVDADGHPIWGFTGPPEEAPGGAVPWWEGSRVVGRPLPVVFGHWARMGLATVNGVRCLDGACVYGGALAALEVETGRTVTVPLDVADLPSLG